MSAHDVTPHKTYCQQTDIIVLFSLCIEMLGNVGGVIAQLYFTTTSSLLGHILAWYVSLLLYVLFVNWGSTSSWRRHVVGSLFCIILKWDIAFIFKGCGVWGGCQMYGRMQVYSVCWSGWCRLAKNGGPVGEQGAVVCVGSGNRGLDTSW